MKGITILGTGSRAPARRVTNAEFETLVETSDEWIRTRTGIGARRFVDGETNLDLTLSAARRAIEDAGVEPEDIGIVICATVSGDYQTPALACLLQRDLGLREDTFVFDLGAACSGFVYAVNTARALLAQYPGRVALVTGSEVLSKLIDFTDRSTCVLFGDGAGAAVIAAADAPFCFASGARGNDEALYIPGAAAGVNPFAQGQYEIDKPYIHMSGSDVFRFAVESISGCVNTVLEQAGKKVEDVKHFVCHQANERIIQSAAKRLKAPIERFFLNIAEYGNTSAASVPIALDELSKSGKLHRGDSVVLAGFGGGFTYGAAYFVW